ncbi:uncharacterized protein PRCAT00004737001 [Priceomyces carsonii]|uniref:uncharacterized protein n=1 Tax=Priceomyces carsonii TaxID=28549 RepID=UPI002EDAFBFF|nr:unnamed protein product [Priceomyces carsonii]
MGLDDLVNKGKSYVTDKDGNVDYKQYTDEAKEAYDAYNKKEGTTTEKAKAAYESFGKKEDSKK